MRERAPRVMTRRLITGLIGAMVLLTPTFATAGAVPTGSGSGAPAEPVVTLNAYCQNHGGTGRLTNGRTVYCVQVQRTDAFVWSYSRDAMTHDPNTRAYTCVNGVCRMPDGSIAPGYQRCGILCGEPPTSGDIQSGFSDCFNSGASFEECERRIG